MSYNVCIYIYNIDLNKRRFLNFFHCFKFKILNEMYHTIIIFKTKTFAFFPPCLMNLNSYLIFLLILFWPRIHSMPFLLHNFCVHFFRKYVFGVHIFRYFPHTLMNLLERCRRKYNQKSDTGKKWKMHKRKSISGKSTHGN